MRWVANGVRAARADLVSYFYLRASHLLRPVGGFGLIATNTIAQGDTREVGLDQLVAGGLTLHRAIASEPWPGGASLEMATVWARRAGWAGCITLDRAEAVGITPAVTLRSRVEGKAKRLVAGGKRSFEGWKPASQGFVLAPDEAEAMLEEDSRNAEVIRPYCSGEDLSRRPDATASRWVIDFRGWPEEKAREYRVPFARVEALVRPERAKSNREAHRKRWWQFGETRQCSGSP